MYTIKTILSLRPPLYFSHRSLVSGKLKTEMLQDLWTIKSKHKLKKPPNFGLISVQEIGLKEEKTRVIKLKAHHINLEKPVSSSLITNPADIIPSYLTAFTCGACGRVYKNASYLKDHLKKSTICSEAITAKINNDPSENINVMESNNFNNVTPVPIAPSYVCNDCGKSFNSKKYLDQHTKRSRKNKELGKENPCDLRRPTDKGVLDIETGLVFHYCDECGKKYKSRKAMLAHKRNNCKKEIEIRGTDPLPLKSYYMEKSSPILSKASVKEINTSNDGKSNKTSLEDSDVLAKGKSSEVSVPDVTMVAHQRSSRKEIEPGEDPYSPDKYLPIQKSHFIPSIALGKETAISNDDDQSDESDDDDDVLISNSQKQKYEVEETDSSEVSVPEVSRYTCDRCGSSYKTEKVFKQHIRRRNKRMEMGDPSPCLKRRREKPAEESCEVYSCDKCLRTYKTRKSLIDHQRKSKKAIEEGTRNPCYPRQTEISDETVRERTRTKKSKMQKEKEEEESSLTCKHCGKEYKLKYFLMKHLRQGCPAMAEAEADTEQKEEKKYREEMVRSKMPILVAFFDTMINTDCVEEAYEQFKALKMSGGQVQTKAMENIELYDVLLRGFARKNELARVQELWRDMDEVGLKPSAESYVSALICLSNVDTANNVFRNVAQEIYNEFTGAGHNMTRTLSDGNFYFDDKRQLMQTLTGLLKIPSQELQSESRIENPLFTEVYKDGASQLESHINGVISREELNSLVDKQLQCELAKVITVPSICRNEAERSKTERIKTFTDSLETRWKERVREAIETLLNSYQSTLQQRNNAINMRQFLACIPIESLVNIVLNQAKTIINYSDTFSEPHRLIIFNMGAMVMEAYHLHNKTQLDSRFWEDHTSSYHKYLDWYADPRGREASHREALQSVSHNFKLDRGKVHWPRTVIVAVGQELIEIMMREISLDIDSQKNVVLDGNWIDSRGKLHRAVGKISYSVAAFFKLFRARTQSQDVEEMKAHPSVSRLYEANQKVYIDFNSVDLPMLCPPVPWVSSTTGAYLAIDNVFIKIPIAAKSDQEEIIRAQPTGSLDPILDSVNNLSSVPWRVNKPLLDLAINLFRSNDNALKTTLDMPLDQESLDIPLMSENLKNSLDVNNKLSPSMKEEYTQHLKAKNLHAQFKKESHSQWCDILYRLSLARYFQDDILWFPHNIDFRGRCYPMPPLFNHMGSDLPRSLLVFAKGKPLGKDGFSWLKLHCINLTGLKKKESVQARLEYVEELMPDILDSAANPMDGRRWWLESDDPWQTLSVCIEIAAALKCPEGPENYVCHLPIHQDGSCNGLQHYAALGRDSLGARAVNLVPAPIPGDVYSEIAAIVERKREEDSANGDVVAAKLDGFVRRKVVKQTVMTTVYGVTNYGATKQIAKQLKDIDEYEGSVDQGSKYLSEKTFESLNELFTSSQVMQDWLTECASVIAGECQRNVTWITPLGLPVVQPYSFLACKKDKTINLDVKNMFKVQHNAIPVLKVNKMKHRNGFPPNFIHSLDSSHMMLTAAHLWSKGITFASVHDCYWTHVCDVELMNKVCREQFISLHSSPILEKLSEFFQQNYLPPPYGIFAIKQEENLDDRVLNVTEQRRKMLFQSIPKKGDLDLNVVKDSVYFFS